MRAARNMETEVVTRNRSDLSVQCSRSFFFPGQVRHGRHARTPRQHLPPSLVGGADRPKGRESRRTGSVVRCRNKACSYGICPPQRKYLIFVCTIFLTVKVSMTWAYTIVSDNLD